jgi:hypothetical protein
MSMTIWTSPHFFSLLLDRASFSMDKITTDKKKGGFYADLARLYSLHLEDVVGNRPRGDER